MVGDCILLAVLVVAFALLVCDHVALVFGLLRRRPRWHAPAALLVVPLAPWWGWQARMRGRAVLWIASAVGYVVALALSLRGI